MSTIKFSLGVKPANAKPTSTDLKPRTNKNIKAFDHEDEDEEQTPLPSTSGNKSNSTLRNPSILLPPTSTNKLSRQQKLRQEEAAKLDSTVFEYDEVYDDMKQAESEAKKLKEKKGSERKPQYISGLIETAKQREIDRVRAEDKMVQREREAEGEEFAGKDSFVTPAYLEQQAELRRVEEEERLKAEKPPTSQGMATFYKNILDENAKRHEAAVKAVASKRAKSLGLAAVLSSGSSGTVDNRSNKNQPQYDPEPESVPTEAKLAAEVEKKLGTKIDLDDEGRIVDHRQLLTGGLNLGPPKLVGPSKPKKAGFALPIAERARQEREQAEAREAEAQKQRQEQEEEEEVGLSQADKLRLSRQRQTELIEQQLLELANNKRKAEEDAKNENAKKAARRNDDTRIEALRQKAIERRKEREQVRREQITTDQA